MRRINLILELGFLFLLAATATAQPATKTYRGSVGGSNFQMRLSVHGTNVTGAYSYDTVGEDIKLTGSLDAQGKLNLIESDARGKPSGRFVCKQLGAPEPDCMWSRPDGTRETYVTLAEQNLGSANFKIVPKTIANRRAGVKVSYPQLMANGGTLNPGAPSFNRKVLAMTQKAIKDFEPGPEAGKNALERSYNVLLATDELISVELTEYQYSGGAHPNDGFDSLTYALLANKELELDELFKSGSDYKTAIAKYVVADIEKRAIAFEEADAKSEGRKPVKRDDPIVTEDQLSEISGWGLTPHGLVVYFDFPHAIAAFDRTVVPYNVISEYLEPNGPASRIYKH
jgi:hypothetical protein